MRKLTAVILFCLLVAGVPALAQTAHSVTINCSDADPSVVAYHFYRSATTGGPYSQIDTSTVTVCQFTDNLVAAGQTWFYIAKAANSAGDLSSASNEAKAVLPQAPQAPSSLAVTVK